MKNLNIFSFNYDLCFLALIVGIVGLLLAIRFPGVTIFLLMSQGAPWATISITMINLENSNQLHNYLKIRSRLSLVFLCVVVFLACCTIVDMIY